MSWPISQLSAFPMPSISFTISLFLSIMEFLNILFSEISTSVSLVFFANQNTHPRIYSFRILLFLSKLYIILANSGSVLATIFFSSSSSQTAWEINSGQKSVMKQPQLLIQSMFLATSDSILSYFCMSLTKLSNWSSMGLVSTGLESGSSQAISSGFP